MQLPSFTEIECPKRPSSFDIPCFNKGESAALITAIREAVEPLSLPTKSHHRRLQPRPDVGKHRKYCDGGPGIRAQRFAFDCEQSAALRAGMQAARGQASSPSMLICRMTRATWRLLAALLNSTAPATSVRGGTGQSDGFIRMASSLIANWDRNQLSNENISDAGCCYRVFKRECIAKL